MLQAFRMRQCRATAVAAAVAGALGLAAGPVASAQESGTAVDTSAWKCRTCPFQEDDLGAEIELGGGSVDDASAKFGDYTGLDDDGAFAVVQGRAGNVQSSGWFWDVEARDLGLDARSVAVEAGKSGRLELSAAYRKLPHTLFDTTSTPYASSGRDTISLPAGFVRAGATQQMANLGTSLRRRDIGTDRESISAAAEFVIDRRWSVFADFRHDERDGTWRQGAAFAFSSVELPRPVDYVTDRIALGIEYGSERFSARLAYEGSLFNDRARDLRFGNPYLGADEGRIALAPDNEAHMLDASFDWRLGTRTALSAVAALGRIEQNEAFVPFTTNAGIATGPLPRADLDGKVETTHLSLALSTGLGGIADVFEGLSLRADVSYDERDNKTPRSVWDYVVTDTLSGGPETNNPYGFKHLRIRVNGGWDLRHLFRFLPAGQRLHVSGGWRHDEIERTLQEVDKSKEDMGWGRVRYRPAAWLDLSLKAGAANRDVDPYVTPLAPDVRIGAPQNPLLRKYNMADREREFGEAQLSIMPVEALSLTGSATYATNDYVNSPVGLQLSRDVSSNFEASWTIGKTATLSAFYGWSEINARQRGSQSFGSPDWTVFNKDVLRTGGASLRLPLLAGKLDLDLDWFFANTRGSIETLDATGTSRMPALRSRMNGGQVAALYHWSPALALRAAVRYERLKSDDWQLDLVEPATVPTLLSLGADAWNYEVTMFVLSFRYRFGAATEERAGGGETEEDE